MKKFGILVIVFMVCLAFLGFSANADIETQKISLNGSTSMEKMINAVKEGIEENYPELSLEPQFTGSSAGIEAVLNGTADIGNSSRYLKDAEKEKGLTENTSDMSSQRLSYALTIDITNIVYYIP